MGHAIKVIVQFIAAFVLVTTFSEEQSADGEKDCTNVKCKDPPPNAECTIISEESDFVPKPKGKQAECCPLWKCQEKSKSGAPEFYTFHGDAGGSETVQYKSTGSGNGDPIFNDVSSSATGNHDSMALASDTKISAKEMSKEMDEEFISTGINMTDLEHYNILEEDLL